MSIAKTILSQIKAIDAMSLWAWGAKNLVDTGDGLRFKSSGMVGWKGFVHVKYDEGQDLYNIDFFKVRAGKTTYADQLEGVFVEDLVHLIDQQVR